VLLCLLHVAQQHHAGQHIRRRHIQNACAHQRMGTMVRVMGQHQAVRCLEYRSMGDNAWP
jgi:hypothetical protein